MSLTNAMYYALISGILLAYLAILVSPKESITFKVITFIVLFAWGYFIYTNKIT